MDSFDQSALMCASAFELDNLYGDLDGPSITRGISYFKQARVRLVHADPLEADLTVIGSQLNPYSVNAWVEDDSGHLDCSCPMGRDYIETLCKHKIAAALFLEHYFSHAAIPEWERHIRGIFSTHPAKSTTKAPNLVIVFSLQASGLVPYVIGQHRFKGIDLGNAEEIVNYLRDNPQVQTSAVPMRSSDFARCIYNTPAATGAAQIMLYTSRAADKIYTLKPVSVGALIPSLIHSPLFVGTSDIPFSFSVAVQPSHLLPHVEIREMGNSALEIVAHLMHPDGNVIPSSGVHQFISRDPVWVGTETALYRVEKVQPQFVELMNSSPIQIPAEFRSQFLDLYLEPLLQIAAFAAPETVVRQADGAPTPRLYLEERDEELRAILKFAYGPTEVMCEKDAPALCVSVDPDGVAWSVQRDITAETRALSKVTTFGLRKADVFGQFSLKAKTSVLDFLLLNIPEAAREGFEIFGEDNIKSVRINRSNGRFTFNVSSGIDWFDLQVDGTIGDVAVPVTELKRALRRQERYIKLADGSIGAIPEKWLNHYQRLFKLGTETKSGIRFSKHHALMLADLESENSVLNSDKAFKNQVRHLAKIDTTTTTPLPTGLNAELRDYQVAGYNWLNWLYANKFGGCLADDMGIGKTIQALAFLQHLKEMGASPRASLVVVPKSLLFNWQRECARFTPDLTILQYSDSDRAESASRFGSFDIILTTYGVALRDQEMLAGFRFNTIVLDEAQAIKNPASLISRAVRTLVSDHRFTLTGTPVENSTTEIWSQFAFLNPGLLGNLDFFREQFVNPIEKRQDQAAASLLKRLIFPFILRRTKEQVATELPARTERILYAQMTESQSSFYEATKRKFRAEVLDLIDHEGMNRARIKVIEALLRLRQIANHPQLYRPDQHAESGKMDVLRELIETVMAEGNKCLIFSQFVKMLGFIRNELEQRSIPYCYLDGSTRDRESAVERFQTDDSVRFFLISLKAGGVGLNLTAADYVVHIDPWWNPAVERQATDRAHRIGQDKPVFVYKLITQATVEEKIMALQERKQALSDSLVTAESSFFKTITREDVQILLD